MTITREPLYEDAPSGRLVALCRHAVSWFASIGQAMRLMLESFVYLPGAVGVGRATQRSVIISFLLILMFGYMITRMFYLEF